MTSPNGCPLRRPARLLEGQAGAQAIGGRARYGVRIPRPVLRQEEPGIVVSILGRSHGVHRVGDPVEMVVATELQNDGIGREFIGTVQYSIAIAYQ